MKRRNQVLVASDVSQSKELYMKLKTRSVTILTDDEIKLVSGGEMTKPFLMSDGCSPTEEYGGCGFQETWPNCNTDTTTFADTYECHSRDCDPYETVTCTINVCLDTEAQCNTEACG